MISIKIDKNRVQVPTFNELTVKQYRDLLPFIAKSGGLDILRYISITTGIDYQKSLRFQVKGLDRLERMIGTFRFIKGDAEPVKGLSYIETVDAPMFLKARKKYYDFRNMKLKEVGYRILIEEFMKTKPSVLDLYIFMTAAIVIPDFDYEEVITLKKEFENYNAFKILSIGAFFLHVWKKSEKKGSIFYRMFRKILLTNTGSTKFKLVLTNWRSINN